MEQLHQLLELGFDKGQGFYFARPLPPESFGRDLWEDGCSLLTSPLSDPPPTGSAAA